jgi:hypothetical protein
MIKQRCYPVKQATVLFPEWGPKCPLMLLAKCCLSLIKGLVSVHVPLRGFVHGTGFPVATQHISNLMNGTRTGKVIPPLSAVPTLNGGQ